MNKHRLFVAVDISPEIKGAIAKWEKAHQVFEVPFSPLTNLHITLIPPFYAEDFAPYIKCMEKAVTDMRPFTIVFNRIIPYPANGPKYLWLEMTAHDELYKLKTKLEKELGTTATHRDFHPHITLLRFKNSTSAETPTPESVNWSFTVNTVTLFESKLKSTGAVHIPIQQVSF